MDRKQIIEMLNDLEMRFPTSSWIIDGIHIWPILRIMISQSAQVKTRKQGRMLKDGYINDSEMQSLSWLDEQVDAVFLSTNMYKIQVDQVWYDRFCDPIKDIFIANQHKLLLLETESDKQERKPRYTPVVPIQRYLDSYSAKYSIYTGVHSLYRYKEFHEYTTVNYKIEVQAISLIHLSIRLQRIRNKANFFKMVFGKTNPKVGFVINYYGEDGLSFNLACYEFGIPSIDIQHGVQGDYHIAYGNWGRLPVGGYRLLPTYFWCWSEEERKSIEKWSSSFHQPIVLGNLWLEQWRGHSPLTEKYDKQFIRNDDQHEERRILVTLQPLYGLPGWENNLPDWFLHAIKDSPSNWKWWIRLHPQMFKGRYDFEAQNTYNSIKQHNLLGKVEIKKATELPLYALLRHCDIHITGHSTTVIEAEQFGVPSVIIHINGVYHYPEQIKSGWAVTAFEQDDLIRSIETQIRISSIEKRPNNGDFHPRNLQSIYTKLYSIMNDSPKKIQDIDISNAAFTEFLEMNGSYREITEQYYERMEITLQLTVARSYYQLEKKDQAISLYQYCIEKLAQEPDINILLDIDKIIEIIEVYPLLNIRSQENLMAVLEKVLRREDHIGFLLRDLYQNNLHDWVIRIGEIYRDQSSNDLLFYVGKSYKYIGNIPMSVFYLDKYTGNFRGADWKGSITSSNDYLLSAYFHLGECQFLLQNYDQSLMMFSECVRLSNGSHGKADAYIKEIQFIRNSKE